MKMNVKEFLAEAGVTEPLYPGKRLVHACRQPGEFKSHCVVFDWRHPEKIRMEVKAGLTGRDFDAKELRNYPLSFQMPTYVDIEVLNDNKDKEKEDEEGKSTQGSQGGGGKQPKKSLSDMKSLASSAFGTVTEGTNVPMLGKIVEMVVMGKKIAAEAYGNVMGVFAKQIAHAKIGTTELLAKGADLVTKYMPPSFMAPTGDEQKNYKYDREKNANIGYRPGLG